MAGFFDLGDPQNAALLAIASRLFQAGAPARLPMPFGLALARALQTGREAPWTRPSRLAAAARRPATAAGAPFGGPPAALGAPEPHGLEPLAGAPAVPFTGWRLA